MVLGGQNRGGLEALTKGTHQMSSYKSGHFCALLASIPHEIWACNPAIDGALHGGILESGTGVPYRLGRCLKKRQREVVMYLAQRKQSCRRRIEQNSFS